MDGFFVIFLFVVAVIIIGGVFRCIRKKDMKEVVSKKYYNHASHLFDYQNDPNDPKNILSPSNPAGPNWVGQYNGDRHNRSASPEAQSSDAKNINQNIEKIFKQ